MGEKKNIYVIFKLNNEYYGVIIDNVTSIEKMQKSTKVPNTKEYVEGVINLRGDVIAILDLRKKLGMDRVDYDKETRIIIVNYKEKTAGLIVDSSSEVIEIMNEDIDNPPVADENESLKYVKGIGKANGKLITLLDLEELFADEEEK